MHLLMRICAFVMIALACTDSLPEVSRVDKLRLLSVRMDPPEVAPGEMATVAPLAVDPGRRPLTYAWVACDPRLPLEDPADCKEVLGVPLLDNGDGRAEFSVDEVLATFRRRPGPAAPDPAAAAALAGGGRIVLPLVLKVRAGNDTITAVKRIVWSPGVTTRNKNPQVLYVVASRQPLDAQIARRIPAGLTVPVGVVQQGLDFEVYDPDGAGPEGPRPERHHAHWFATGGTFLHDETVSGQTEDGPRSEENEWTAPEEAGTVRLWVVVTDGRGGETWEERPFEVLPRAGG